MEDWADRIKRRMAELKDQGRTVRNADIARACKIEPGSVSGWFGAGKKTKMISGDHLVSTAQLLDTTAEYLMTGKGVRPTQSQPVGLDAGKLAVVLDLVDGAIKDSGKQVPASFRARMVKRVYENQPELTPETADAVRVALAGLLEDFGD